MEDESSQDLWVRPPMDGHARQPGGALWTDEDDAALEVAKELMSRVRDLLRGRREHVAVEEIADALDVPVEDVEWASEWDDDDLTWSPPDRWGHLPSLLDGIEERHVLTAEDLARGQVPADADLAGVLALHPRPVVLTGGADDGAGAGAGGDAPGEEATELELDLEGLGTHDDGWWTLPGGTLDDAAVGDVLVAHHTMDGLRLAVEPPATVDTDALDDEVLRRLDRARHDADPEGRGLDMASFLLELAADEASLLATGVPFGDLIAAAGLVVAGDYVLPPGTDEEQWRLDRTRAVHDPHGDHDDAVVDGMVRWLRAASVPQNAYRDPTQVTAVPDEVAALTMADARGLDAAAADPDTCDGVLGTVLTGWVDRGPALGAVADRVVTLLEGRAGAGVQTIRAHVAERAGDEQARRAALDAALSADASFGPALEARAFDLELAGDHEAALRALRRAEVAPWDPAVVRLEQLTEPAWPDLKRNEPCPCGSGRKAKQCHLDRPAPLSEDDVAELLVVSIAEWLQRPAQHIVADNVAGWFGTELIDVHALFTDPVALGIALVHGQVIRAFADRRGVDLPGPSATHLDGWLGRGPHGAEGAARWDVLEVLGVDDDGVDVRCLVDDAALRLDGPQEVEQLADAEGRAVLTCRVTRPDGSWRSMFATFVVPEPLVEEAVAATGADDPRELARWWGGVAELLDEAHG